MGRKSNRPGRPAARDTSSKAVRRAGWFGRARLAAIVVVLALAGAAAWWLPAGAPAQAGTPAATLPPKARALFWGQEATQAGGAMPMQREQRLRALTEHFKLADHTYCSYREGSKYPASSRPIADNPDQVYPNQAITESNAMRTPGGGTDRAVQIETAQSRVFLAAGESVVFSIRAVEAGGKPLSLVINRAIATGITYQDKRQLAPVSLAFADDGRNGDAVAGDGAFTGMLTPSKSGLAGFSGTIRTQVNYSVNGRPGVVNFDVIHTPELPALWTGAIRDVMENGALSFVLPADIRQAGRYVVHGRVDDANGKPFALVSFNDMLAAGPQEIRLTVFGKLVRDQEPAMPLSLRDVDAYLLKENTDPDRALMPRMEGRVHISKTYAMKGFSDAEWQSEERTRYLTEFAKDLGQARTALEQASLGAALPPSECH